MGYKSVSGLSQQENLVQRIKTTGKSVTNVIWLLVAGKSGAKDQNCRKICDKLHLALSSRKIFDKLHFALSSREIWCKGSKPQENL